MTHSTEKDAACHPGCAIKGGDHPGTRGYRCMNDAGETLPFPGEDWPGQHDYPTRVIPPAMTSGGAA